MTKDDFFKDAAMDLAKTLCSIQQSDGGWEAGGVPKSLWPARWPGGV